MNLPADRGSTATGGLASPLTPWWREWQVLALVVLVVAVYWARLGDLPIRGEETRWAEVAREMKRTGDWVVPRQQGEPFLNRPPLGCWLIALAAQARGQCDVLAVRWPTAFATLAITLLIYGYARLFLSRTGALAAAAAYATMGQVLELGRLGESDGLFTLFVSGSLFAWHWGFTRGRLGQAWVVGYLLAAFGALAKGPQAPIYFCASVGAFLIFTGQARLLWSRAHFLGLATFAAVVGAWLVPLYPQVGWAGLAEIWLGQSSLRLLEQASRIDHMVRYPVEVLACTLPWSILLLLFATRQLRRSVGDARSAVAFLVICLAVTFPTCWPFPSARARYFMPLYPCLAVLIGLVIQRCTEASAGTMLRRCWSWYLAGLAGTMAVLGIVVLGATASRAPALDLLAQPPIFAIAYGLIGVALALALTRAARNSPGWSASASILTVAAFMGLTFAGAAINTMARYSEDTAAEVARLKEKLPVGVHLVSFGQVIHPFVYHYGERIPELPWPQQDSSPPSEVDYFCFLQMGQQTLPFAWEPVAVISCDRYRGRQDRLLVVVGRRCAGPSLADTEESTHGPE